MKVAAPLCALILFLLCSCNSFHLEKRHYRNGFYFANSRSEIRNSTQEDHAYNGLGSGQNDVSDSALTSAVNADSAKLESIEAESVLPSRNIEQSALEIEPDSSQNSITSPVEEDPVERQIRTTQVLGTVALTLVILGLLGIELSVYFLPLLLIGIGCAIFGLKIGKLALQNTKYGKRDKGGNKKPNEKRSRAKRAYWLSLSTLLIVMGYVIIRFVIIAGLGSVALAFALLGVCLLIFLLFKMGVFSDLAD